MINIVNMIGKNNFLLFSNQYLNIKGRKIRDQVRNVVDK